LFEKQILARGVDRQATKLEVVHADNNYRPREVASYDQEHRIRLVAPPLGGFPQEEVKRFRQEAEQWGREPSIEPKELPRDPSRCREGCSQDIGIFRSWSEFKL